ncbi:hypothetical protein UlMin_000487 [Ulmus minor]
MFLPLPCKTPIFHNYPFSHNTPFLISFVLIPFLLHSPISSTFAAKTMNGNETDRLSLLAIKAWIIEDPYSIMNSWNDSVHFCKWVGITCGHLHQRVTSLNLTSYNLVGSLSPSIGNLSFLSTLNLNLNNFRSEIPPQLGRLFRLKYLDLSNNSFSGEIPANLLAVLALFGFV